ncbi:estradiol 17-beta-dehydrogenase 11-like [Lycorma delicatula]|uniref:estradiol 17-beta-dehydrogenase 11-like n=1 Tax=Lycorma delicatula TaxID=130591 RepID=UPI003F51369F
MSNKSTTEAVNNFINGELGKKGSPPICQVKNLQKENDTTVCGDGLVKEAITRLNSGKDISSDDPIEIPTLKPPGVIKREIRDKGKLLLQLTWILIQIIPAILYSIYIWVFPGKGKSLKGKVAVVTGAGRGLGRGLALGLSREGCKVACVDIDINSAQETVKLIKDELGIAQAYRTNVGRPEEIRNLQKNVTKDLGPVTYLINNASLILSQRIDADYDDSVLNGVVSVNLLSYFYTIRTFLPEMRKNKEGHIVAIASMSSFTGLAYSSAYVACKWAIRGLMETLRDELKKDGDNENIHLTCVHPYFINTSGDYTENWSIRFPELTIDEVVEKTIEGIKHEWFSVSIPEDMYYIIHLSKLLPIYIYDQFKQVCHADVKVPEKEKWNNLPPMHIIKDTLK